MERVSRSEMARNPYPRSGGETGSSKPEQEAQPSYDDLIRDLQNGGYCLLPRAIELVREALIRGTEISDSAIPLILRRVGYDKDYTYHWRFERSVTTDAVYELARVLSDSQLWPLLENAIGGIEKGWHWLQPLSDNIQLLCVARACARGGVVLKTALERQMRMHRRWICGLDDYFSYESVTISPLGEEENWHTATAQIFNYLLNSRTGEVLASAIHGIHCLALHHPEVIKTLFELTANDEWRARWILNAAEFWAFAQPAAVNNSGQFLTAWFENGPLEHRLQAWVIKAGLAIQDNQTPPTLPWPTNVSEPAQIVTRRRDALELPPLTFGLMHVSDRHRAATQHLDCLEAAVGELEATRHRTAQLLDELPERQHTRPWPECMRQHGDTNVGLADVGLLISRAIEETMPSPPLSIIPRLAQGFLPNEDPWILRQSPFPDSDLSAWPDEDEMGGWQKPPDISALRERLLILACEHGVETNEIVLGARVEVYSSFYDVHFSVWWEQRARDESEISAAHFPTTISARSFCWWLGDWWQPRPSDTTRPLTFTPGGFQRLPHCFVESFPARLWIRELNWNPSRQDPLTWTMAGRPVARFQRLHGRTRQSNSHHYRQPTLSRWLVTREAFEDLSDKLQMLRRSDDIAHAPSPER